MDVRLNKSEFTLEDNALWNKKTIDVFRFFSELCNTYNLRWFCGFGTVLGAIRHKGMIPWDDDVDVCMPRDDYNKLLTICENLNSEDYELISPESNIDYYSTHVRMMDKHSSILFWRRYPCVMGIYIDIFPMDGIINNKDIALAHYGKFLKNWFCFRECHAHYSFDNMRYYLRNGQIKRVLFSCLFSCNRKFFRTFFLNKINKLSLAYSWDDSDYVLTYLSEYNVKQIIPKRWVETTILVDFEGMKVPIPEYYDEYLQHFYNNYMELPPIEERNRRHKIDYYNLHVRESYEDILHHIKEQGR